VNQQRDVTVYIDNGPPLSTVTVHFVVDGTGGNVGSDLVSTYRDEEAAHRHAREIRGFVVSWPVSADYREET
jgi:hypothetical protein